MLGQYGKFGNQLFQIASTIGLAKQGDLEYCFNGWEYQDYFVNPLPCGLAKYTFSGYLQDYRHFDRCKDLIRYYFEMKPVTQALRDTIFIHYRDYEAEGVSGRHPVQTREYYREAVKHFPGKKFMVFSDNVHKAMQVIDVDCVYSTGSEMYDFYRMSHCDGGIISNSSFSWWAGWLCGGKVVAPSNWFAGRKKDRDTTGLYLPEWIKI